MREFHTEEYLAVLRAAGAGAARCPRPTATASAPATIRSGPGSTRPRRSRAAARSSRPSWWRGATSSGPSPSPGGLHHAMPARASGFCYLNDAVLAILALRRHGLRVGVRRHRRASRRRRAGGVLPERRRADDLHARARGPPVPGDRGGRRAGRGAGARLRGQPAAPPLHRRRGLPRRVRRGRPPVLRAFGADVVVAQLGIDGHRTDPLTHLALSVDGFAAAVRRILGLAPRLVALGGGGYDLSNVARAWTVAWALMNDVTLPPELPPGLRRRRGAPPRRPADAVGRAPGPAARGGAAGAGVRRAPGRGAPAPRLPAPGGADLRRGDAPVRL